MNREKKIFMDRIESVRTHVPFWWEKISQYRKKGSFCDIISHIADPRFAIFPTQKIIIFEWLPRTRILGRKFRSDILFPLIWVKFHTTKEVSINIIQIIHTPAVRPYVWAARHWYLHRRAYAPQATLPLTGTEINVQRTEWGLRAVLILYDES